MFNKLKNWLNKFEIVRVVTIELSYKSFIMLREAFNNETLKEGDNITVNAPNIVIEIKIKKQKNG